MKIERVVVGALEENCYILKKDGNALVIDPGAEIDKINEAIGTSRVVGVLVTHHHFDHVGALPNYSKDIIYDFYNLEEKEHNIENFKFKVIYTRGHSSDSISYYFEDEKALFSGDFIFYESIGRWDMPSGDFDKMLGSIEKIKKYPSDIKIYPGHGDDTTLKHEIENNFYFKEN